MTYWISVLALRRTSSLAALLVLLAPGLALAQEQFHETHFDNASEIGRWTISSGNWQVQNGAFVSSAAGATDIAKVETYDPFDLDVIEADVALEVSALITNSTPNGLVGVVFDFGDPTNYHEITFSAAGEVHSLTVRGGETIADVVRHVPAPGINKWFRISVRRVGTREDVKVDGVPIYTESVALPAGDVGLITHNTRARFDDFRVNNFDRLIDPYRDTFLQHSLRGWTNLRPQGNGWAAGPGGLESLAIGPNDILLTPLVDLFRFGFSPNPRSYTIKTQVINRYSGSGNLVGVVFLRTPQDYDEVVFSPNGMASLRKFVNGVRTTLATAPYVGGGSASRPFLLEVAYRGNQGGPVLSQIKTNGHVVFENLPFNLEDGEIGLVTHFSNARFLNFAAAPRFFQPLVTDFSSGSFPREFFSPISTWRVQDGALNSYGIGKSDIGGFQVWDDLSDLDYRVRVTNHYGNSGNLAGLMYAYRAPDDYYEAVFSPTGVAYLNRVLKGVTTNIATASYSGGGAHQAFDVQLVQHNRHTSVLVNGVSVFSDVDQPDTGVGFAGVVTHWTNASFDNVSITEAI